VRPIRKESMVLVIRAEQMEAFDEAARLQFENEMVAHSKQFAPRLCEVLGDAQLRTALRSAIKRSETHGFTKRGPIRLYIEMMFLCGSAFDTDPQYPLLGEILRGSGDEMERAEQIHHASLDYLKNVSGADNVNVRRALAKVHAFAERPVTFQGAFTEGMLDEITGIFPQKVAYIGKERVQALIDEGIAKAQEYNFTTDRPRALIVALMFSFGHGCTDDPLYPWIGQTLRDERIVDAKARAARLEKKALTWLDHVLARSDRGES
jgi:hypothetical protein